VTVDIAAAHRGALDAAQRVMEGIISGQWDASTPCAQWNVRQLANHLVSGNWWAHELAGGATIDQVGERLDGDVLGDDPAVAHAESAEAAAAAFEAPGALNAPCAVSYGPVPGTVYAGHRFIDVLIHGWDLAAATDQDTSIDPGLVRACFEVIEPQMEILRASGMFGVEVHVAEGADDQTRLLAALGRVDRR
jgi:uncharacterized protein (TIGR03086 family)